MAVNKIPFIQKVTFKLVLFVLLFVYIVGLFKLQTSRFQTDDPIPDVISIDREMRKQFRDFSTKVRTGLFIENFSQLDFVKNDFIVDAMVWFEFNKNQITLDTIEKFTFENSKMLFKSSPQTRVIGDNILAKYKVNFSIKTDLDYHRFPLSDHRVSFVLTNDFVSPNELYFDDEVDSISFNVAKQIFTSNWKVHSLQAYSGYTSMMYDQYHKDRKKMSPAAVFTINFDKTGVKEIMIIFIPLFAAAFFALFTFLMSFNHYMGKLNLSLAAMTSMITYRFVIQQLVPNVGYFTVTDKIYIFLLLFAFFVFAFQLLLARQYMFLVDRAQVAEEQRAPADRIVVMPKTTEKINNAFYFLSVMLLFIMTTYFIAW